MKKKLLGLVCLVGVMAMALAGCGKEPTPTPSIEPGTNDVVENTGDTSADVEVNVNPVVSTDDTVVTDDVNVNADTSADAGDELAGEYFGTYVLNETSILEVDEDGYVVLDTDEGRLVGYVYKNASGTFLVACEQGADLSLNNFLYVCWEPITMDMNTWTATCDADLTKRYTMVEIRDANMELVGWGIPEKPVKVCYQDSIESNLCVKTAMYIILPINGKFTYDGQTYTNVVGYIQGEYDEGRTYEVLFTSEDGSLFKYATLIWTMDNDYVVWYIGDTPESQP